jgi:cytoskeleton protein RodZ
LNVDIGAQLRAAREAKGLSIGALAGRTRIPTRSLTAIELNDRSSLPPHPFGRGFIRTYAEEVDLDPDQLVRDYFAQFPTGPAPAPVAATRETFESVWQPGSRWAGMGTAVAILVVVVAAAVVFGRRGDSAARLETVGTTGQSPATSTAIPTPGSVARSDAATTPSVTAPTAPPQSTAITVTLSMSRPCWIDARVDGRRTIYRTLQAGERETLRGERDVAIRFGDAGAVTWTINGRDAGTPGLAGAVRDVLITPQNAAAAR